MYQLGFQMMQISGFPVALGEQLILSLSSLLNHIFIVNSYHWFRTEYSSSIKIKKITGVSYIYTEKLGAIAVLFERRSF